MHQGALLSSIRPCRFIANRRYPISPSRRFSSSRWLLSTPHDPHDARDPASKDSAPGTNNIPSFNNPEENSAPNEDARATTPPTERSPEKRDQSPYGSAFRRAMRNAKPQADSAPRSAAAAVVPDWFYERNTIIHKGDGPDSAQIQQQVRIDRPGSEEQAVTGDLAEGGEGDQPGSDGSHPEHRYALKDALWEELRASVKAGMGLPPPKYANEPSATKSHLVLQYPGNDGIVFLDAVVKRLANELGTDLVTLSAQDIAQLCTEYDLSDSGMTSPIRSLGYEVYQPSSSRAMEDAEEEEEEPEEEGDESSMPKGIMGIPKFLTVRSFKGAPDDLIGPKWRSLLESRTDDGRGLRNGAKRQENSWSRLVNELVGSPGKLSQQTPTPESFAGIEPPGASQPQKRDVIVQVQDYRDIQSIPEGSKFLSLLQQAVQDRRIGGSRIMLIGTTAQGVKPSASDMFKAGDTGDDAFAKTLVITPAMESSRASETFAEDRKKRTLDINIRHLQEMFRTRLNEQSSAVKDDILGGRDWPLDPTIVQESGLGERYWLYSQVHWAATLALGCVEADESFGFEHIQRGIELMQKTDRIKNGWLQEKSPKNKPRENNRERLLGSLRKTCNRYEKKLLNGVVDSKSIRTTFSDVHATPDNVEALKTLTSLSLVRPEAFTYGVLATDKIPGLLLYGPPGTGKTLLAKAVARDSGATVLEVSGSDVYDMYVGEGEKNVRAIFTLAKKLSPCVVFIDEADAIFCSRTGGSHRSSHRELINQFLREWDGMNDMSALIMVATNRPFDLDDAVLRRLPRRLLVDLPTEQDRLSILKIHLKDETLDPAVDLAELARRTPLYSGSDLKNLSVAAALACVRDENAAAVQHQGEEPYQYPERRTLTGSHFERGMEEISASINEDMSSLTAIKKFDEQYGDRKGRRKKSPGWGFVPPNAEETGEQAARVRG
jgi:hypothetical protein